MLRTCQVCNKKFHTDMTWKLYCSKRCSWRARREKIKEKQLKSLEKVRMLLNEPHNPLPKVSGKNR